MTLRAIAGIAAFNGFVLVVGAGVLWGMRGWRWWTELVRLLGVAYFLGLSALMVVTMVELVLGIPLEPVTLVASGAAVVALGVAVGRRRGFGAPRLRPPDWRFPRISAFVAVFVAAIVVFFEALFRADRVTGVAREWDSWANWLPKSRWLYLDGRVDLDFYALVPQLASYPPGHNAIQAAAFHAMGSDDTATLHLLYWFMAVFFVAAVAGLLAPRVRGALLFPVLLALLVVPYLLDWLPTVYADIPMGYLLAVAALLVVVWLEEGQRWHLVAATLLLSGAMLTKREGMLFAACVLLAGLVASLRERRRAWPRLFAAGAVALALVLPWRIWFTYHDLPGDGPDTGYLGAFDYLDRVRPSFRISVETFFHEELWRYVPIVAVAAIALALLAGAWRAGVYAGAFFAAGIAAVAWVLWSNLGLVPIHDDWAVRRLTGTPVLVLVVLTPLLLQRAWSAGAAAAAAPPVRTRGDPLFGPSLAAWGIVLLGLLSHPGSAVVGYSGSGLPGGWMSFPGSSCDGAAADGESERVVGYADSYPEAQALQARASADGLGDVRAAQDGCGRVRVYVAEAP